MFWYQEEIDFFEMYVIPLAEKLKQCGVFGVSSDECLTYAEQNLAEWKAKGRQVVDDMVCEAQKESDLNVASVAMMNESTFAPHRPYGGSNEFGQSTSQA